MEHKESQNIFKQIEQERMEFQDMFGECFPTPEEHWRWHSLGIQPNLNKDVDVEYWLNEKDIHVDKPEDLKNVQKQSPPEEQVEEECPFEE